MYTRNSKSDWAQVLDMELQAIATDEVEKQNSRDPTQTSLYRPIISTLSKRQKVDSKASLYQFVQMGSNFGTTCSLKRLERNLVLMDGVTRTYLIMYHVYFTRSRTSRYVIISNALCLMSYLIRYSTRSTSICFMKVCNMKRIS